MSSLSRNSCAKAFGNWSRGENFRPKTCQFKGKVNRNESGADEESERMRMSVTMAVM